MSTTELSYFLNLLDGKPITLYRHQKYYPHFYGLSSTFNCFRREFLTDVINYIVFKDSKSLSEYEKEILDENIFCLHSSCYKIRERKFMNQAVDLAIIGLKKDFYVINLRWRKEIEEAEKRRKKNLKYLNKILPKLSPLVTENLIECVAIRGSLVGNGRLVVPHFADYHNLNIVYPNDNINFMLFVSRKTKDYEVKRQILTSLAKQKFIRTIVWFTFEFHKGIPPYDVKYEVAYNTSSGYVSLDFCLFPWFKMPKIYEYDDEPSRKWMIEKLNEMVCLLNENRFLQIKEELLKWARRIDKKITY